MLLTAFRPTEVEQLEDFEVVTEEFVLEEPDESHREETTVEIKPTDVSEVTVETIQKPEKATAELTFGEKPKPTVTMQITVPEAPKPKEGTHTIGSIRHHNERVNQLGRKCIELCYI